MRRFSRSVVFLLCLLVGMGEALPAAPRAVKNCLCACYTPCGNVCCCVEKAPAAADEAAALFAPSLEACGSAPAAVQNVSAKGEQFESLAAAVSLCWSAESPLPFSKPKQHLADPPSPPPKISSLS